jgi:hypothetical protein
VAGARCRIKPIVYIYGTFAGKHAMDDPIELATTEVFVNETTVIETTWVGLSCELFKLKLMLFFQFLLLVYVVFKLEKRLEKVEKRSTEGKMPMEKV